MVSGEWLEPVPAVGPTESTIFKHRNLLMSRTAKIERKTAETQIEMEISQLLQSTQNSILKNCLVDPYSFARYLQQAAMPVRQI